MSLSNCPYLMVLPCLLSSDGLKMSYDVSFPMVCSLSRHYVSTSIGSHRSCSVGLLDCPIFASSFCLIIGTGLVLGSQLAIKISEPNWVYFFRGSLFWTHILFSNSPVLRANRMSIGVGVPLVFFLLANSVVLFCKFPLPMMGIGIAYCIGHKNLLNKTGSTFLVVVSTFPPCWEWSFLFIFMGRLSHTHLPPMGGVWCP